MQKIKYKITIKSILGMQDGYKSIFSNTRAFFANPIWEIISKDNLSGRMRVSYGASNLSYWNEFEFDGADDLKKKLMEATEKELVNGFQKA